MVGHRMLGLHRAVWTAMTVMTAAISRRSWGPALPCRGGKSCCWGVGPGAASVVGGLGGMGTVVMLHNRPCGWGAGLGAVSAVGVLVGLCTVVVLPSKPCWWGAGLGTVSAMGVSGRLCRAATLHSRGTWIHRGHVWRHQYRRGLLASQPVCLIYCILCIGEGVRRWKVEWW